VRIHLSASAFLVLSTPPAFSLQVNKRIVEALHKDRYLIAPSLKSILSLSLRNQAENKAMGRDGLSEANYTMRCNETENI
jgi:hypothetical protein